MEKTVTGTISCNGFYCCLETAGHVSPVVFIGRKVPAMDPGCVGL